MQTTTIRIGPNKNYGYTYIRREQVEDIIDLLADQLFFSFPGAIDNCTREGLDIVVTFDDGILNITQIKNICNITNRVLDKLIVEERPCVGCGELFCCHCWSS